MDTELLQQVIADQKAMIQRKDRGMKRHVDVSKHLKTNMISVITGVRRSGKSTLTLQIADHYNAFYFVSFDDERLMSFKVEDFNNMLIEMKKTGVAETIVLDEIQHVDGWERFVRRLNDEGYKVIITGSNAHMLSSELATHLTGRYLKTELFPFSFPEYLDFISVDTKDKSSNNKANILNAFDHYLQHGGFPEYLQTNIQEILKRIYDDIIYRDLIVRFGIRNVSGFKNLAQYLFANFTKPAAYLQLTNLLGFSSTTSVKDYIGILQEGYLLFEANQYDHSLKRQYQTNRKVYVIDNGLRNAISFRTSADNGRLLENIVYLELRRREYEIWYYRSKKNKETDFLIRPGNPALIQVCYDMHNPLTRKREFDSLLACMKELKANKAVLLTKNEQETVTLKGITIHVLPVWQWLLDGH